MIEIGCNSAVDGGLYTISFGKSGATLQARYTFTDHQRPRVSGGRDRTEPS